MSGNDARVTRTDARMGQLLGWIQMMFLRTPDAFDQSA
jgi:hypothetical protein